MNCQNLSKSKLCVSDLKACQASVVSLRFFLEDAWFFSLACLHNNPDKFLIRPLTKLQNEKITLWITLYFFEYMLSQIHATKWAGKFKCSELFARYSQ
jgi:hypothetical protein